MPWLQNYDPLHSALLSTLVAAVPVVVLLGLIATEKMRVHYAALTALAVALTVACAGFHMPIASALAAASDGAAFGLMPIGWMILNLIFLYRMTVEKGWFDALRSSFTKLAPDKRIQLIFVAFCFGAFFEGIAGFGAPVAVSSALLIQLGFAPLEACVLSLIANTAPVAFGSLGIPVATLAKVTGLDVQVLAKIVGRQLTPFCFIVPSWIMLVHGGWRALRGVWPVTVVAGVSFGLAQLFMSNWHGPMLVDIVGGLFSMACVALLLMVWKPKDTEAPAEGHTTQARVMKRAWLPWIILTLTIFIWSQPESKNALDGMFSRDIPVPALHLAITRTPPVVPPDTKPEEALYKLNLLSATGTGILFAAIISGFAMGFSPLGMLRRWLATIVHVRLSLLTIASMMALGFVTKYSGADATLGLALAKTGWMYPFFGTLLGWLGVALTGSDTSSNVLFGSLQTITAHQVGVSPALMAAANTTGGVMGKMIDAQSIVVASTAAQVFGQESAVLRRVFWHSIALAALVGLLVMLQAYVWPFTETVAK
jgi:lactate permease